MSSISGPEHLSGHHRDTLLQIFQEKTNHNVEWHDVMSLLEAIGSIEQQHDDMFLFRLGQETEVLRRPSTKDIDGQQLRRPATDIDERRLRQNGHGTRRQGQRSLSPATPAPSVSRRRTMAKLIYVANTSLDGYTEDPDGGINWGTPDEEYFSFINDLERPVGTYLYGRRMYESMVYWETAPTTDQPPWVGEFSTIWRAADKIVFSKDPRFGVEREDDP